MYVVHQKVHNSKIRVHVSIHKNDTYSTTVYSLVHYIHLHIHLMHGQLYLKTQSVPRSKHLSSRL